MKNYIKKQNKSHILSKIIMQIFVVFVIATISIILYDMYIKIEIEDSPYNASKTAKEISAENSDDVSTMIVNASKGVVRNIKNRKK